MKKIVLASTVILALSAGGALAQSQPTSGASSEGNVGPGAGKGSMHSNSTHSNMNKGTTTGAARSSRGTAANPSSSGNVGPGTNNNSGPQPGGR
jgi:hypothetical protein